MATNAEKIAAEQDARQMLADAGLPEPDEVEYGYTCIRVLWHEPKICLVVQIDEPPDDLESAEDESEPLHDLEFAKDEPSDGWDLDDPYRTSP